MQPAGATRAEHFGRIAFGRPTPTHCMPQYAIRKHQTAKGAMCWVVAFSRDGKPHAKRFYWLKLGGSAPAKRAAIAWRDEQLASVPALSLSGFCARKRSNNTSDAVGVHFLTPARQPEGIWQAKLRLRDGTKKSQSFSVRKHGHDEAYALAVMARKAMLETVADRFYLHDPVAEQFARLAQVASDKDAIQQRDADQRTS